jgi:hypothetical protein
MARPLSTTQPTWIELSTCLPPKFPSLFSLIVQKKSTLSNLFWLSWEALFSAVVNRQLLISSSHCTLSEDGDKEVIDKKAMKKEVMKLQ